MSIEKAVVQVTVIEGKDLVAKDRNLLGFGKKTTSDPFCEVYKSTNDGKETKVGATKAQKKTLNPQWNQTFVVEFLEKECSNLREPTVVLKLFDHDKVGKNDAMGTVRIPLTIKKGQKQLKITEWYEIPKDSAKNAKGQLHVALDICLVYAKSLIRGNEFPLSCDHIQVGLAWDMLPGRKAVDLDVSSVAIAKDGGNVLMSETVYYGNVANSNESVLHSGDERTGDEDGDDEKITIELRRVPETVLCMYIVLTVATPDMRIPDIESTTLRVYDTKKQCTLCKFTPASNALSNNATAMFMIRLARKKHGSGWVLATIEDTHPTARDFGSLIPYLKSYTRDLIPTIEVDPTERVAIMRKGGNVRLSDYIKGSKLPSCLTFGLAWDVTDGVNIDLDASAICLDSDLKLVDLVCGKKKLQSSDGSIRHQGDEREGDEIGDDEKLDVTLSLVAPNVHYIAFIINSYSGQELDDVARASCHLFDPSTGVDVATYAMTNDQSLDGHTALLVGCLYRGDGDGWGLFIISEAAMGKKAKENVEDLQIFLRKNRPKVPPSNKGDVAIKSQMPTVVPLAVLDGEIDLGDSMYG